MANGNGKRGNGVLHYLLDNSIFMIVGVIVALVLANAQPTFYRSIVEMEPAGAEFLHPYNIHFNLHWLVNEVAMVFFFAIAGIEIRESMLPGGKLSSLKTAGLPLLATVGGVVFPALIFYVGAALFESALQGAWAVPTATDIAFSYLAARLVLGKGHPAIPFLLLLAVADDAIGLVIIAVAYPTGAMNLGMFGVCLVSAISATLMMNRFGVRSFWWYLIPGAVSWWGFLQGGVHPALALVPLLWFMPHEKTDEGLYEEIEHESRKGEDTLTQFEHFFKNPVELLLFFFALANAGVEIKGLGVGTWLVMIALVVGKPLGIVMMTKLGARLGLKLAEGISMNDVVVVGQLAGIGFTVALFVSGVAMPHGELQDQLKLGALLSFLSAFAAAGWAAVLKVGRFAPKETE